MPPAVPRDVEAYVTRDGKDVFQGWLDGLADRRARALIDKTIAKIRLGNLGRHKSVGEGVQEIVLDCGPGYRIYFGERGTKQRQQDAIRLAKQYWNDWKERTLQ
jgi:putative addiction module killer protein